MRQCNLKESDYLKAWALFAVCATVGGFIAGALVGAILGFALGMVGTPTNILRAVCGLAGFVVGLPISYLFFRLFVSRMIVRKVVEQMDAPVAVPAAQAASYESAVSSR